MANGLGRRLLGLKPRRGIDWAGPGLVGIT